MIKFEPGMLVRIIHSGYDIARIAEIRGKLGPGGAMIYRVAVREGRRPVYIEVREDQLVKID